jgi:polysaccharide export outer membrane protein
MFQQKDYKSFQLEQIPAQEYVIKKGDEVTIRAYSRQGFDLLDVMGGAQRGIQGGAGGGRNINNISLGIPYTVDIDGYVDMPILGKYYVEGYTQSELEDQLESELASYFNDPFVMIRVPNRRAFVYKGQGGQVIQLNNAPTNLLEVLALSGGLGGNLKAYKIKIIRGDLSNPEIILVDLSTIEGLRDADLLIQTNDLIYIEERPRVVSTLLRELTPIVALLTLTLSTIALIRN